MDRKQVLRTLKNYSNYWIEAPEFSRFNSPETQKAHQEIITFVNDNEDCLLRTNPKGHLTGSAIITSPEMDRVLLTLHSKLGKWLQLGGHADGNPNLASVALREAKEESGISSIEYYSGPLSPFSEDLPPIPFDVDVHEIPENAKDSCHYHLDLRYLLIADPNQSLKVSNESKDLRWFSIKDAYQVTKEPSLVRLFEKLEFISEKAKNSKAAVH